MSKYTVLPAHLHGVADAAVQIIKKKYGLGQPLVETPIHKDLSWTPTLHWKTKEGRIIACEVHEAPMPVVLRATFGYSTTIDLPVKIIVAHPSNTSSSQADYFRDSNEAKRFGFGLLAVNDDNTGQFQHQGIEVSLFLAPPTIKNYAAKLRSGIQHAYDIYINSDPKHGVQELGQLIEHIIQKLAVQARASGTFTKAGFTSPSAHYALANLINDLMHDKVIDNAILGRCRGFVDDRNATSHKPKTVAEAIKVNRKLKNAMVVGLQILEDMPEKLSKKNFTLKL